MAEVEQGFALKIQCDECPWRTDVKPGQFPPERYKALTSSCQQGWPPRPIFSCHKTPGGKEQACVGYLLRSGQNNIAIRLAQARGDIVLEELQARGPLYDHFRAMCIANGYDPGDHEDYSRCY
jgi:hypothetical protein